MFSFILFNTIQALSPDADTLLQELEQTGMPYYTLGFTDCVEEKYNTTVKDIHKNETAQPKRKEDDSANWEMLFRFNKDALILTDSPDFALFAGKAGYICFGYAARDTSLRFPSVPLVLESLNGVTVSYLQREFAHAKHEPALLCETNRCTIQELPLEEIPALYDMMQQELLFSTHSSTKKTKQSAPFLCQPLGTLQEELEKHKAYIRYVYPLFPYGIWGIYQKQNGHLLGRIGITEGLLYERTEYVLEYFIHPDHRNLGYAAECMNAVLHYAAEQETESVCICIHKDNIASLRVLTHCVFPYTMLSHEQEDILTYRIVLRR